MSSRVDGHEIQQMDKAQVVLPFSGGDKDPENPAGFGKCAIDSSSIRHACPEDLCRVKRGARERDSMVNQGPEPPGATSLRRKGDRCAHKISTFTHRRKTSTSGGGGEAG